MLILPISSDRKTSYIGNHFIFIKFTDPNRSPIQYWGSTPNVNGNVDRKPSFAFARTARRPNASQDVSGSDATIGKQYSSGSNISLGKPSMLYSAQVTGNCMF
jgi:hypothetical protein